MTYALFIYGMTILSIFILLIVAYFVSGYRLKKRKRNNHPLLIRDDSQAIQ